MGASRSLFCAIFAANYPLVGRPSRQCIVRLFAGVLLLLASTQQLLAAIVGYDIQGSVTSDSFVGSAQNPFQSGNTFDLAFTYDTNSAGSPPGIYEPFTQFQLRVGGETLSEMGLLLPASVPFLEIEVGPIAGHSIVEIFFRAVDVFGTQLNGRLDFNLVPPISSDALSTLPVLSLSQVATPLFLNATGPGVVYLNGDLNAGLQSAVLTPTSVVPTPEPSTLGLLCIGLFAFARVAQTHWQSRHV